jgi:DNA-binding SARP family transcriptional activator
MARLSLILLGGFQARLDSGAPVALPTRKAQGLVAFLAMPAGLAHSRDKLASLLWGSTAEASARTSLRQTLYAVRKSVRGADPTPLRMEADSVALDPHGVSVDVAGFLQRIPATTASTLADALALYQGDFLEGLVIPEPPFEDWLLGERERLREQALEGLGRLLAYQRAAGETEAAVQTALRLLALDPLQESAHCAPEGMHERFLAEGVRVRPVRDHTLEIATDLGVMPVNDLRERAAGRHRSTAREHTHGSFRCSPLASLVQEVPSTKRRRPREKLRRAGRADTSDGCSRTEWSVPRRHLPPEPMVPKPASN